MKNEKKSVVILVADDDPEDCLLIKDAFKEGLLSTVSGSSKTERS